MLNYLNSYILYFSLIILVTFSYSSNSFGQIASKCSSDFSKSILVEKDSTLKKQLHNDEILLRSRNTSRIGLSVITIPIIVHILYNSSSENVHDSSIYKFINTLNEDFGRTNPDTVNTPVPFQTVASSTGIQFCLAQQDSLLNPINGIEHIFTNVSSFNSPLGMEDASNGGVSAWNTDNYFNIWIGNAAFANVPYYNVIIYPSYHDRYGLLLDYRYVNEIDSGIYIGRQITHAMGHCLNLAHLFNAGPFCADPDSVSDTPPGILINNCPTFPEYTCNTAYPGDMFMNFMYEIWDESCQNLFTAGQATRIVNSLNLYYPQLINSLACNLPNSTSDDYQKNIFKIYPNPTNNFLNIEMNSLVKKNIEFTVNILDRVGNIVISKDFNKPFSNAQISLESLKSGYYFCKILCESRIMRIEKLIILK